MLTCKVVAEPVTNIMLASYYHDIMLDAYYAKDHAGTIDSGLHYSYVSTYSFRYVAL